MGLDVGTKRQDDDEELVEAVEEPKEKTPSVIDPYHTWFNKRQFSDDQKAEADKIMWVFVAFLRVGANTR